MLSVVLTEFPSSFPGASPQTPPGLTLVGPNGPECEDPFGAALDPSIFQSKTSGCRAASPAGVRGRVPRIPERNSVGPDLVVFIVILLVIPVPVIVSGRTSHRWRIRIGIGIAHRGTGAGSGGRTGATVAAAHPGTVLALALVLAAVAQTGAVGFRRWARIALTPAILARLVVA